MRIRKLLLLVAVLAASSSCRDGAAPVPAPSSPAAVRVLDGDTFDLNGERIRLWGIDAPERSQKCRAAEGRLYPCGVRARLVLADLLRPGMAPSCATVPGTTADRYGRKLARCKVGDLDVGGAVVAAGWAVDFTRYSGGYYMAQERTAAARHAGMWAGSFTSPDEYRATRRRRGEERRQGRRPPAGR